MGDIFSVTLSQIVVFFAFIGLGYWLKKTGKVTANMSKGLSVLTIYVFVPLMNIGTLAENFKINIIAEKSVTMLASVATFIVMLVISKILSKAFTKEAYEHDVYDYSFTFPNSGYFGAPLVLAVFGEQGLFDITVFTVPFYVLTYTYGMYLLNPDKVFSFKKLLNFPMVSAIVGMIIGVLNIPIPNVLDKIMDTGASCLGPTAMLLTGMVFATLNLKVILSDIKPYVACAIKLLIVPFIVVFVLSALKLRADIALSIATFFALPTGLNGIVFPEAYGGDSKPGAQLCFISTIACSIAIPCVYALLYMLNII